MLAIGPSTIGDSLGLFTTVDVAKGTILCLKKGILLDVSFWSYIDYNTSNIRVISMKKINTLTNQPYTFIMDKDDSVSYSDFIRDPLDPKLINATFTEERDDGKVVLAIKHADATDDETHTSANLILDCSDNTRRIIRLLATE